MTDPLALVSGILAQAVVALNASTKLHHTIRAFQSHPRQVQELLAELSGLTTVLQKFSESAHLIDDAAFSALRFPLGQCGRACNEVETEILTKCMRSGADRRNFRGWINLKCGGDDGILGFQTRLARYKSIVTISLCFANLGTSATTAGVMQDYRDLITTTIADLRAHLEEIEQKTMMLRAASDTSPTTALRQHIDEERLSTDKSLQLCTTILQQIDQFNISGRSLGSATAEEPSPNYWVPDGLEDHLAFTVGQLGKVRKRVTENLAKHPKPLDLLPSGSLGLSADKVGADQTPDDNLEHASRGDNAETSHVLTTMANLASTCMDQGWWDEAEKLEMQVIETSKKRLGEEHPSTLTSIANLASMYRDRGRWDKAETLEVQVMESSKTTLGADHPDTLTSMANLASTFCNQGRWTNAEELYILVVKARMIVFGADHPSTLTSMANLASTYRNQGRLDEAEELEVQVMETSKTKLGADHPSTLTSMANLASTYMDQGRWTNAEELYTLVVKARMIVFGADHPSTLTSMANLASTYRNQGRLDEAEELEVQVMETSKTKLGLDHPSTLTSMANLASTYRNQGRLDEAEMLGVQVMKTSETKLGADHPSTLTSKANLASTYWKQGRLEEAEKLDLLVMETLQTKLGSDHPAALRSMANLAMSYISQGRGEEAAKLQARVTSECPTPHRAGLID